jgi:solute carrier family 66 (lysosomal lysine-arginine transporter), member 1
MVGTMVARSATASTVLGYMSLGAWLGAQFPQLIENARRQSVDGLALPFLANWFFGLSAPLTALSLLSVD